MVKKMSADYVIDITKTPDVIGELMRITNGVGVDYVIEAVGRSQTYEQAFDMIRRGGKLESFGICSDDDYAKLPPAKFVLREKKISGSCAGIGHDWSIIHAQLAVYFSDRMPDYTPVP